LSTPSSKQSKPPLKPSKKRKTAPNVEVNQIQQQEEREVESPPPDSQSNGDDTDSFENENLDHSKKTKRTGVPSPSQHEDNTTIPPPMQHENSTAISSPLQQEKNSQSMNKSDFEKQLNQLKSTNFSISLSNSPLQKKKNDAPTKEAISEYLNIFRDEKSLLKLCKDKGGKQRTKSTAYDYLIKYFKNHPLDKNWINWTNG